MSTKPSFLKTILLSLLVIYSAASLRAQVVISSEKIAIKKKDRMMSCSGADGNFVLIKESKSLRVIHYDTAFKTIAITAQDLSLILNKDELMGAAQTGRQLTILLSDKEHAHFSILKYDVAHGTFSVGLNFDMDDNMYLNWFIRGQKINIVAVKKKSSLLSIVSFDSTGVSTRLKFDMSKENFKSTVQKATLFSVLEDRALRKFPPGTYQNDFLAGALCKMFYDENELFLTLNTRNEATQLIEMDLDQKIYASFIIPYAHSAAKPGQECDGTSFYVDHQLVTAFVYPEGLSMGLYDLDSSRYLREWGPGYEGFDSIRTSPYLFENAATDKEDTLNSSKAFQKKLFGMSRLSVAANKTSSGDLEIYVGGIEFESSGGGGGGMMIGGGGAMAGGGVGMPMMVSSGGSSTTYADDETAANVKKHYFFRSTVDRHTMLRRPVSPEARTYEKYSQDLFMTIHSELRKNAVQFNQGTKFYLGFYVPDQGVFCIARYK